MLVVLKASEGVVDLDIDFFGHDQLAITPTRKISGTKGKRGYECLRAILTSISLLALRIQWTLRPEAMLRSIRLSLWSFEIVCVLSIEGTSQVFVDFVWRRVGKKGKRAKIGG